MNVAAGQSQNPKVDQPADQRDLVNVNLFINLSSRPLNMGFFIDQKYL